MACKCWQFFALLTLQTIAITKGEGLFAKRSGANLRAAAALARSGTQYQKSTKKLRHGGQLETVADAGTIAAATDEEDDDVKFSNDADAIAAQLTAETLTGDGTGVDIANTQLTAADTFAAQFTADTLHGTFNPDPKVLVWDAKPQPGGTSKGWLSVPLDPDDSESPTIKVRVQIWFATVQPAPLGLLFTHCGGPGSTKSCPTEWAKQGWLLNKEAGNNPANAFYDVFGMDQRGAGETGPSVDCQGMAKWAKGPGAEAKFESLMKKYKKGSRLSVHDFTDCPCAMGDGAHPIANGLSAAVDPSQKAEVSLHFQSLAARSKRCYDWSKWKLPGKSGKVYNFLDHVGTNRVVGDIEAFRQAVGASKLSLIGAGYGTLVCGMYATMFGDHVEKLMLNSCMDPELDAVKLAKATANGFARTTRRLLQDCSEQPGCPLNNDGNAFSAFDGIYKKLRSEHGLTAPMASTGDGSSPKGSDGAAFRLTPGLLTSWLLRQLSDNLGGGWTAAVEVLGDLTDDSKHVRTKAVTKVLNEMCAPLGADSEIFTWHYGVCIGNQVEEADGTLLQAATLAVDYAGRYSVQHATRMAQATYEEMGEFTSVFIGYLSNMFAWPVLPQPAGTIGNPSVKAVVVGNLYDPISAYTSSQAMHQAFPAGSMVTWQGVGHIFQPGIPYDNVSSTACNQVLIEYMKSGKLPPNGKVCLNRKPLPLTTNDDNDDDDDDEVDDKDQEKPDKAKPAVGLQHHLQHGPAGNLQHGPAGQKKAPAKSSGWIPKMGLAQCSVIALTWVMHV